MAKKKVEMSAVAIDVATVTTSPGFRVTEDSKVLGDLRVSTGGLFWRPKSHQQYFHLNWEAVDELFKAKGTPKTVGEYKITPPAPGTFEDF
jgi:hypothetical protein